MESTINTIEYEQVSRRVVEQVAAETGIDSHNLEPLHDHVDPDGLVRLFADTSDTRRDRGRVTFPMAGCQVTVHAYGAVEVTLQGDPVDVTAADDQTASPTAAADQPSSYPAESPD
ncbi:HalOD1 output domain-containing protein [Halobacterium bonnevillei]|uniref:Halobacterial output domain-containing protein n=1 Tax=Halobacterium bonnevillei TaxID=2692200 RepID=A0A6B0SM66_9EURY|nr:HalOD1 output domain-containing protein [Halobacterium bonnevillei]MXR20000.1 hypothetical protein [Halobacterium bonnevillei]